MTELQTPPDPAELQQRFADLFGAGTDAPQAFFAPGRVNLIGEHTDYTGGLVFPCAITRGTTLLIRRTQTGVLRFVSTNIDAAINVPVDHMTLPQTLDNGQGHWCNYPLGVLNEFLADGLPFTGLDCLYSGNIPNGGGLSSSASVEVVTAYAIHTLYQTDHTKLALAQLAQRAENAFVGMPCGILDQFAIAMAQTDHAMMLTCETLDYRQVPLLLGDYCLVISNSNKRRELSDSAYEVRVAECARALAVLQTVEPISSLAAANPDMLEAHATLFADDQVAFQRARHVCSENARVRLAVDALEQGDLVTFGQLMVQSHASLRDDYAVSSEALDILVNESLNQPGVLGSRLTGAGFGGCTVSLVLQANVDAFKTAVGEGYRKGCAAIGENLTADFSTSTAGGGVRALPV